MKRTIRIIFSSFKSSLIILLSMGFLYTYGAEESDKNITDATTDDTGTSKTGKVELPKNPLSLPSFRNSKEKGISPKPVLLKPFPPRYPLEAYSNGITGFVIVKIKLTKEGVVKDPVVIKSIPEGVFDESAIECVKKWKFKPATNSSGEPIDSVLKVPIKFEINTNDKAEP